MYNMSYIAYSSPIKYVIQFLIYGFIGTVDIYKKKKNGYNNKNKLTLTNYI